VTSVEPLGERREGCERSHDTAQRASQSGVFVIRLLRRPAAVIARHQADDVDLVWLEAAQVSVANQILGVLVMALIADVHTDVVEERAIFQPLAFLGAQLVD